MSEKGGQQKCEMTMGKHQQRSKQNIVETPCKSSSNHQILHFFLYMLALLIDSL